MEVMSNFTQVWNEISLSSSDQEKLYFFCKDYFKALSEENMNSFYYAYSYSVIHFLDVPLPIGERIFKCSKKDSVDFIVIDEFLNMIKVFFIEDIRVKCDFFFKMMDFDNDKIIHINDMLLFFHHLNYGAGKPKDKANIFINKFFDGKSSMTLSEYLLKIVGNCDVVLLFYYSVYNTKSFNEEVIEYYFDNIYSKKRNQEVSRKVQSVKCMPLYTKGILKKERKSSNTDNIGRRTVNFSPCKKTRSNRNVAEFSMKTYVNVDVYPYDFDKENDNFGQYKQKDIDDFKEEKDENKEMIQYNCSDDLMLFICENYKVKSQCFILHEKNIESRQKQKEDLQKQQQVQLQSENSDSTTNALDFDQDNDDLELLNIFERDKQKSFDLFNITKSEMISSTVINYHTPKKALDSDVNNPHPYRMYNTKSACKSAQISSPLEKSLTFTKIINSPNHLKQTPSKSLIEFTNVQDNNLIRVRLVIVDSFLFSYTTASHGYPKQHIILLKDAFIIKQSDTSITIYSSSEIEYTYIFSNTQKLEQFMTIFTKINSTNIPFDDQYDIKGEIGHGHFGRISLVKQKSSTSSQYSSIGKDRGKKSKWFCLKTINKNKPFFRMGKWEGYISKYLSQYPHENIIKFYEVYEDAKVIKILMEYDSIETLDNIIYNQLSTDLTKSIMSQIINAVDFLNSNGITHRDIKLENVIFNQDTNKVKVIDFGLSKVLFPTDTLKERCGTLSFTAPEIIMDKQYNYKVDIWSVGIIAYIFEYHKFPYDKDTTSFEQMHNEMNQLLSKVSLESDFYWHESLLRMIIRNTLLKNPDERFAPKDLIDLCMRFQLNGNN